jgi:hypothetical protein
MKKVNNINYFKNMFIIIILKKLNIYVNGKIIVPLKRLLEFTFSILLLFLN